jgi:putative nucleotidyltransferase with HDIG domain
MKHTNISTIPKGQMIERLYHNKDTQMVINTLLRLSLEDILLKELLQTTINLLVSIPWLSSKGAIFLVEGNPKTLVMKAQSGLASPLMQKCAAVPFGKCLCGRAALEQKIQFSKHLDEVHEIRYEGIEPHGHYCIPILHASNVLGVINLYVNEGHVKEEGETEFLASIADTLAGIIIRKQAEDALKQSMEMMHQTLDGTVNALGIMAEKRDQYTAGHQQRVAQIACGIANMMGLSADKIEGIRVAGTLHDIGKVLVPAEILSKPGKLTALEMSMIKCHPQTGCDILQTIPFQRPVAKMVIQHHERIDGSGYPFGLSGRQILLEAKIISVADVVEAMTSHRPYRPALGEKKAIDEILQNKGIIYDTEVVDACLSFIHKYEVEA